MKFEIDPNELTTEQRNHVAAFITGWPVVKLNANMVRATEEAVKSILNFEPTEEERLDAEQNIDLGPIGDADLKNVVDIPETNLNAIFGAPNATPGKVVVLSDASIPSVPLDKEGLPWDSRIHASTKTFIADGTWKLRRGVDPAEVEKVKAQLKELMAVPTVTIGSASHVPATPALMTTNVTEIPSAPVLTPTSIGYVPVPQATISDALSSNAVPVSPVKLIDQQHATVTLTDLISRMSAAIVAGKMTQATVAEMCTKRGVSEFMLLSNRPDLLPLIDADMKAMGV